MLSLTEQLNRGPVVSDGAMATELEKRGVATNSALWSATAMLDHPDAIQAVHQSYLDAGAKIMTTNTYQANVPAFEQAGIAAAQARQLIQQAVTIAHTARDASHVTDAVIAGSIGPYGAYLADGSEYTGAYQLTPSCLSRLSPRTPGVDHGRRGGRACIRNDATFRRSTGFGTTNHNHLAATTILGKL